MTRRHRGIVGCLMATATLAPLAIGALASPALAGGKNHTICHATSSAKNPFVVIHPATDGVMHGHLGHQDARDIIPPFTYKGREYSQNWDAAGQAVFHNGCAAPAPPPELAPPAPTDPPPIVVPPEEQQPPDAQPPAGDPPPDDTGEPLPDQPTPGTFGF